MPSRRRKVSELFLLQHFGVGQVLDIWLRKSLVPAHTSYLSQTPQTCLYKNFLSGVNFSRLSEKKCIYLTFSETFLVFLVPLVVILGVKFGFRKSCLCKRNDKYEVCSHCGQSVDLFSQKIFNQQRGVCLALGHCYQIPLLCPQDRAPSSILWQGQVGLL